MKASLSSKLNGGHGGDIYRFLEELLDQKDIIDFSASINPLGMSNAAIKKIKDNIRHICHYPDPQARQMRLELARQYNIDANSIVCGNGSTELIYLIVQALKPKKVLIAAPTFSEYKRAVLLRSQNSEVRSQKLKREDNFDINTAEFIQALRGCDMAFLCNPNNPTGRLITKKNALKIATAAKQLKCYFVVDEAFIDFMPEESVINEVKNNPYLIVLRSMTKFYALSGLRVGYGVFPINLVNVIEQHKEPWTVNSLAQMAAIASLNDITYKEKTLALITKEKRFLEKQFQKMHIDYLPSSANYYLIRHDRARDMISSLKNKGILVRDCSNFVGLDGSYMRIAVKSRKDNVRLLKELEKQL